MTWLDWPKAAVDRSTKASSVLMDGPLSSDHAQNARPPTPITQHPSPSHGPLSSDHAQNARIDAFRGGGATGRRRGVPAAVQRQEPGRLADRYARRLVRARRDDRRQACRPEMERLPANQEGL